MNKTVFWIVLAVAAAGGILTAQIVSDAQNKESREELSIDDLRRISLAEGKIFDDYLVSSEMSPAVIEHFGGSDRALSFYNYLNELLEDSEGHPDRETWYGLAMLAFNFDVLTDTAVHGETVAALVIHERKLAGTYQQPELEPLQKLHTYLEAEYPINATTPSLQDMFGEMSALAPQILEIGEAATLLGHPPYEMHNADPYYWSYVGHYGGCEITENGAQCDWQMGEAKARGWEQPPK